MSTQEQNLVLNTLFTLLIQALHILLKTPPVQLRLVDTDLLSPILPVNEPKVLLSLLHIRTTEKDVTQRKPTYKVKLGRIRIILTLHEISLDRIVLEVERVCRFGDLGICHVVRVVIISYEPDYESNGSRSCQVRT